MPPSPTSGNQQGFALIAALLLIALVGIITATVLETTSTEVKISGNLASAVQAFYAAESGLEEARARLRGRATSTLGFISDPQPDSNPLWSAYILTSATWTPAKDPTFRAAATNFFPTTTSQTNRAITVNSLQTKIPYWVKIRHKNEYDAEQAGHRPASPHYMDGDGNTKKHTAGAPGNVMYFGYPTTLSTVPSAFTSEDPTPFSPIEVITAFGGAKGLETSVEVEVAHMPGPPLLAPLYARRDISLTENSAVISGHDACRRAPSLPPVAKRGWGITATHVDFSGTPSTPKFGSLDIDLSEVIKGMRNGAIVVSSVQSGTAFGKSTSYQTFYANPAESGEEMRIANGVGYGILLVEGPVIFEGVARWYGVIISTGTITFKGDGKGMEMLGAIWAENIQQISGDLKIRYDSCHVKNALAAQPLRMMSWREVF